MVKNINLINFIGIKEIICYILILKTMKHFVCLVLLLSGLFFSQAFGQFDKMKDVLEDEMENLEHGNLTLRFFDAVSGDPLPNGDVKIQGMGSFTTDSSGIVRFPKPEQDGKIHVVFTKEGYIDTDFPVEILAGTIFFNRFSISPELDLNHIRIVLDWAKRPKDLDAHLLKRDGYHISYRNKRVSDDQSAMLDRDDMDGYGPETITITSVDDASEYYYFVHDFSNRNQSSSSELGDSKGTVKVYGEGQLLEVFQVPRMRKGNRWNVFGIKDGNIIELNQIK